MLSPGMQQDGACPISSQCRVLNRAQHLLLSLCLAMCVGLLMALHDP